MDKWITLFDTAMRILDRAEQAMGSKIDWTIGGGTMLNDMFAHRLSNDIHIFYLTRKYSAVSRRETMMSQTRLLIQVTIQKAPISLSLLRRVEKSISSSRLV